MCMQFVVIEQKSRALNLKATLPNASSLFCIKKVHLRSRCICLGVKGSRIFEHFSVFCECALAITVECWPLGWNLLDSGSVGSALLPHEQVRRLLSATSRLLLLSISAWRAASLLKPISMMSLRARSSTWAQRHKDKTDKKHVRVGKKQSRASWPLKVLLCREQWIYG